MAEVNTKPITPDDALAALRELQKIWEYGAMLHGAPGIGKTSIVEQLAKEIDGPLIDLRLTTIDAPDLRGLAYLDHEKKETVWYKPEFWPSEGGKPGILFLDEFTSAEQHLIAPSYSILQERRVGKHKIPDNWFIVAAGNGPEHGAIANEIGTAAADRLIHFKVVAEPKSWIKYAREKGLLSKVITFIHTKPEYLERCELRVREDKMIDASPRGWERWARILQRVGDTKEKRPVLQNIGSGILGEDTVATFFEVTDLLTEQVQVQKLMDAKNAQERMRLMPKTMEGLYGLAYALDALATDGAKLQKAMQIAIEIEHIDQMDGPLPAAEVTTLAMEMLIQRGFDKGMQKFMIGNPTLKPYMDRRREQGLAA